MFVLSYLVTFLIYAEWVYVFHLNFEELIANVYCVFIPVICSASYTFQLDIPFFTYVMAVPVQNYDSCFPLVYCV